MSARKPRTCAGCGQKTTWDETQLCFNCQAVFELGLAYQQMLATADTGDVVLVDVDYDFSVLPGGLSVDLTTLEKDPLHAYYNASKELRQVMLQLSGLIPVFQHASRSVKADEVTHRVQLHENTEFQLYAGSAEKIELLNKAMQLVAIIVGCANLRGQHSGRNLLRRIMDGELTVEETLAIEARK